MNGETYKILLIEDNPGDARLVREMLAEVEDPSFRYEIECLGNVSAGLERLGAGKIHLILLDLSLPDSHGLETFFRMRAQAPEIPIVVLSGFDDVALSIEAVKNGAQDYLVKGRIDGGLLMRSIRYAIERQYLEKELRESELRYKRLVQMMPDIVYTVDTEGKFTFINEAIKNLGYEPEHLMGKHFSLLIHPDDVGSVSRSEFLRKYKDAPDKYKNVPKLFDERRTGERKTTGLEIRLLKSNANEVVVGKMEWLSGESVFIEVNSSGHYSKDIDRRDKELLGTIGIIRDITIRKQTEDQVRKLSRAVEQSPIIIIITDVNGNIEYTNPMFTRVTGYTKEDVFKKNLYTVKPNRMSPEEYKQLWNAVAAGATWRGELCNEKKTGELYWESMTISPIKDFQGDITHFLVVSEDVTERKQAETTIRQMAFYDTLTSLPNRSLFNDRLSMAMVHAGRKEESLAVLFLDLDHFKLVNDTLGHAVGDLLLKAVSERLAGCIRKGDTVARLGGDEFIVLLPGIKRREDASDVAEKIVEKITHPFLVGNHELIVTTSIGVAIYPDDGKDLDTLLRNADIAMYHAKEHGRNNFQYYNNALYIKVSRKRLLESKLRHALERKEFLLHYQPQVNINTGQIVGIEALLRWNHPELGMVSPLEFIPLSEATGLIVSIGEWVLSTACSQVKAWQDAGLPKIRIAVNLSTHTFQRQNFVERVIHTLNETRLSPRFLELEITESTAMQNVEATITKLGKLHVMGIQIAIDDFGTGHSSLNYLRKFPIHTLKIDQSFVKDVTTNPGDASIVSAIIALAKSLKLKVVAEGVETREHFSFLKEHQCEEAQGYLFHKPAPPESIETILRQNKPLFSPM